MSAAAALAANAPPLPASALAPALLSLADRYRSPELAALALAAKHGGAVDVRIEDVAALARRSVSTLRRRFASPDGPGTSRPAIHAPGLVYRPGTGGVDGNTLSRFAVGRHRLGLPAGRHGGEATGRAPAHYRRPGEGWRNQAPRAPEPPSEPLPLPPPGSRSSRSSSSSQSRSSAPPARNVTRGENRGVESSGPAGTGVSSLGETPSSSESGRIPLSGPFRRGVGPRLVDKSRGRGPRGERTGPESAGEVLRRLVGSFAPDSRQEPGPAMGEAAPPLPRAGEGASHPSPAVKALEELESARAASALELAVVGDADSEEPNEDRATAAAARLSRTHGPAAADRLEARRRNRKPWRDASSKAPWRARLQWARVTDPTHQREAERQARRLADVFRAEGALPGVQHGADPARWVPVLLTLSAAAGWEAAMRLLRAGFASGPSSSGRWEGWRRLLERDPRYALRRSFLQSARWGHRTPRGARWGDGFAWEPATPELAGERETWLVGDGPPPRAPGADRAALAAVAELLELPPPDEPRGWAAKRERDLRTERLRAVGRKLSASEELPEHHGEGVARW